MINLGLGYRKETFISRCIDLRLIKPNLISNSFQMAARRRTSKRPFPQPWQTTTATTSSSSWTTPPPSSPPCPRLSRRQLPLHARHQLPAAITRPRRWRSTTTRRPPTRPKNRRPPPTAPRLKRTSSSSMESRRKRQKSFRREKRRSRATLAMSG